MQLKEVLKGLKNYKLRGDENLEIIDNKDIDNQNYIIQGNAIDDESISDNGGGEEILKSSNTATDNLQSTSYVDGKAYNQMSNPTIQTAINNAKDGDTIIITGTAYVHCHFIVNKKLTIISDKRIRINGKWRIFKRK